ncbi:MAG: hypothetical protein HZA91_02080 [Verrucomicrobia bacterium]|nr:hypothetical protein [Verrucomicrobiota bacterium]
MKAHRIVFTAVLAAAVCTGFAEDSKKSPAAPPPSPEQPDFVAGWRVSGVVKQGGKLQASLEHSGRAARFVNEGDELMPGIVVEKIDPANRSVTVRRDKQTAVIRPGSAPLPAKPNTALAQNPQQQPGQPRPGGPGFGGPWGGGPPWSGGAGTATQDEQGRWGIRFANGGFFSAQDYANRFGGGDQALAHINQRMSEQIDPNRRAFYQQMLTALQGSRGGAATGASPAAAVQPAASASSGVTTVTPQAAPAPPSPPAQRQLYTPLPPPGRGYD